MNEYMIELAGGVTFDANELVADIKKSGRDFIIQGQKMCAYANHTKPSSLDFWLRQRAGVNQDTKQADNRVMDALVATGLFNVELSLPCPDRIGSRCKGLRLCHNSNQ